MQRPLRPGELSAILGLLADEERRLVISQLRAHDDNAMSLDALADACRTDDTAAPAVTPMRLHHATLPKLAAADLVHYDPATETVEYRGDNAVETIHDRVADLQPAAPDVVAIDD